MATPAASAYHRRRLLNATTPATLITSVSKSNTLSQNPPGSSTDPPSAQPSSSIWKSSPIHAHNSRSNNFLNTTSNLPLTSYFASDVSITYSSLFRALQVSLLILIIGHLLTRPFALFHYFGFCPSTTHYYPIILNILSLFCLVIFALCLTAAHLFFSHIKASLTTWRMQARHAKPQALRHSIAHALASISCAVVQSIATAYMLFGPSLIPPSLSPSKCINSNYHSQLFPDRNDIAPNAMTSLFAGLFYSLLWSWSGAYASNSYPFHASSRKRVVLYLPRVVLLAAIPTIMGAAPASLLQTVLADDDLPVVKFWPALLERIAAVSSAMVSVFITMISWNAMAVVRDQLSEGGGMAQRMSVDGGITDTRWERERCLVLVKQASVPKSDGEAESLVRDMVGCLYCISRTDKDLVAFPGFSDASGDVWRVALQHLLAPVDFMHELLKEFNLILFQANEGGVGALGGPRRVMPWARVAGGREQFCFADADVCVVACGVLADIFVASYSLDSYGVVQRTLAETVRSLLMCKEQTENFLGLRAAKDGKEAEPMAWLGRVMMLRSERESVAAVDDAIMLAMYRIVGTFRAHFSNFVDGVEVTWDRSLDRHLRRFLEYQVS